jgi:hypothetical protein
MAIFQSQTRVSDEVWQTVCAAQQARLGVVLEALVGALDGGVQRQSRS